MTAPEPQPDLVEEVIALDGNALSVLRPRDTEALLDEQAFEDEEYMPYWAELWPSGVALARLLTSRSLRGARVLELGCGLGVPSIAAALGGGRVTASDWSRDGIALLEENARRSDATLATLVCDWSKPEPLLAGAPWDLVLASDVLYESRNVPLLLELLPRLIDSRGEILLADPGREPAMAFLDGADDLFDRSSAVHGRVEIHRLKLPG